MNNKNNNKLSNVYCFIVVINSFYFSDLQDSEVQSNVTLPIPSSTSVNIKCDYTLSSNVTNITELHKYNSNAYDQEFVSDTTTTWELVINSFDQPKLKRFTDPDVSETIIGCQIVGHQQHRDKRQVDYDVYCEFMNFICVAETFLWIRK
ncbi:unnamed protein product [Schistosoma guineensis]|nr:unnamed protein product [Schistosoma guineensis]